jgi:hypothetical protein
MTRQRRWQLRKKSQGLCQYCGRDPAVGKLCLVCARKAAETDRVRYQNHGPRRRKVAA